MFVFQGFGVVWRPLTTRTTHARRATTVLLILNTGTTTPAQRAHLTMKQPSMHCLIAFPALEASSVQGLASHCPLVAAMQVTTVMAALSQRHLVVLVEIIAQQARIVR